MLKDELKKVTGRKRRFLLLRIIEVGPEAARQLCGITKGTYNSWMHDKEFVSLYRRRAEFSAEYRKEALQLMRRDNQLQAVLLEEKIINKMKEEIESGEYELIRTNLAKEVYAKLMGDLDYQPKNVALTWEKKVAQLIAPPEVKVLEEGVTVEAVSETTGESQEEHTDSELLPEESPSSDKTEEQS